MCPYKDHPAFKTPDDEYCKIWRYMDFPKFVSLLDKKALFFTKATTFIEKFDKYEDIYPPIFIKKLLEATKTEQAKELIKERFKQFREFGEILGINCWHINEKESDAMWKLYCIGGKGIAVQSTYHSLRESFNAYIDNDIHIGVVKYIDYNIDDIPFGNVMEPYLHKRKSYEHENELRAIVLKKFDVPEDEIWTPYIPFENGIYIPVDLETLIEKIYVSPTSPNWYLDTIESIIKKFNISKDVYRSSLDAEPYINIL